MKVIYFYCIMFIENDRQTYRNGSFEYKKEVTSSKEALSMKDALAKDLGFKENDFILISLSIVGKTE